VVLTTGKFQNENCCPEYRRIDNAEFVSQRVAAIGIPVKSRNRNDPTTIENDEKIGIASNECEPSCSKIENLNP